ncbi:MAG TPA: hypothetical protein DEQ61_20185, partial [Streptomyces sp.]|nr:hypothetical protein [Streptomyces sp.]
MPSHHAHAAQPPDGAVDPDGDREAGAELPGTSAPERPTDPAVVAVSGGLLVAFVIAALVAPAATGEAVGTAFSAAARWFGPFWQFLLLATFLVAVTLAFARTGKVRLGGRDRPEYGRFQWTAMIMSTLLAGGGVFFAAGEPVQHFMNVPPHYSGDVEPGSAAAGDAALAQSFTHWGFLAWAVLGSLGAIVMMRGRERGLPLRPRTLLYPLLGDRVRHSRLGTAVDIICIVAVVAGTVG